MSGPIIIPFDNNPASVSVKTASYTVPLGKYAKVSILKIGMVNLGAFTATNTSSVRTFTESEMFMLVNSVAVSLAANYYYSVTLTDNIGNSSSASINYTLNFPFILNSVLISSSLSGTAGSATASIQGTGYASIANNSTQHNLDGLLHNLTTGQFVTTSTIVKTRMSCDVISDFWCKAGDVISVPSGLRYMVTEYNAIS